MIFGTRDVKNDLGTFSSEKCSACKDSYTYHFYKITRFIVVFFMNLIPLGSHYEAVCEGCEEARAVDANTGRGIAKQHFKKRSWALTAKTVFKLAAVAVVIGAAVALPLTLRFSLDTRPETLKVLVSEDGLYSIQDSEGEVLGVVQVTDGVNRLTYYDDTSVLVKEPGADGSFLKHDYRQEATNEAKQADLFLVRIPDNPGILEDRHGTPVRIYHYDTANDAIGYSRGVEDLSAIQYTSNKVTYPYKYYSSDKEEATEYTMVLYFAGNKELEATFIPELGSSEINQFVMLTVRELKNGRVISETVYHFGESTIALAKEAGLTQQSSAQDILDFIEQNKPDSMVTDYEYYNNTKVITKMTLTLQDSDGNMQSVSQDFDVTVKNGYYIVQTVAEEQ
jgi:hypothetical protein